MIFLFYYLILNLIYFGTDPVGVSSEASKSATTNEELDALFAAIDKVFSIIKLSDHKMYNFRIADPKLISTYMYFLLNFQFHNIERQTN